MAFLDSNGVAYLYEKLKSKFALNTELDGVVRVDTADEAVSTEITVTDHTHPEATTETDGFLGHIDKQKLDETWLTTDGRLRMKSLTVSDDAAQTAAAWSVNIGDENTSSSSNSIVLGYGCTTTGNNSFASGYESSASGWVSAAIGNGCHATGNSAVAVGHNNVAKSYNFSCGRFNYPRASSSEGTSGDMFIVGNGTSTEAKNAFRVMANGSVLANAEYNSTGADYAELFEWADANTNGEDRRGLFVTLDGDKIRLANSEDDYILGIVSGRPSVIGDNYADDWCDKYLTDIFGTPILEKKSFPAKVDEKGNIVEEAYEDTVFVLNPSYDSGQTYVPRTERKEWAAIGIVGKLILIDDGTCQENGYCYPAKNGVATHSENKTNYRVMKRIDETHIQVFIK